MRKITALLVGLVFVVVLVAGCSQEAPEIQSSYPQPEGMQITGTIYGTNASGIGQNPLAGATVILSGQSAKRTTTTDSNGEYSFTNVPDGTYIIATTKEGYQATGTSAFVMDPTQPAMAIDGKEVLSDNTIKTVDVLMSNAPLVFSISPDAGTEVASGAQTITVVFNEAMDTTSVRPTMVPSGIRTFDIADTLNLTTSWSTDNKILTITTGPLSQNIVYTLTIDGGATARDASGIKLDTTGGATGGGLASTLYNAVVYRVDTGNAPGMPTGLQVLVAGLLSSDQNLDYGNVMTGANPVTLNWITPTTGLISGYKAYVSRNSAGPWHQVGSTVTSNTISTTVDNVNNAIYGATIAGGTVDPVCRNNAAFVNDVVYFKLVAYNPEGESTPATAEAFDREGPDLDGVADPSGGYTLSNGYLLPDISGNNQDCYIGFSEPIDTTTAATIANYSLDSGSITAATVMTSSMTNLDSGPWPGSPVYTIVKLTADTDISSGARTLTVLSGLHDLTGNSIDTAADTATL